MSNQWAFDLETAIFSMFKIYYEKKFKEKYPDLFVTSDEEQDGKAVFPTVLLQQIGFVEAGQDLEGISINGLRPTFQITISYKGSKNNIRNLAAHAAIFFKDKSFTVSDVIYTISDKIRTATFRATRIVGSNDNL